jgi:hypothetical protein
MSGGIGLITNYEVKSSDVSLEQSQNFMKHETNDEDIIKDFIIDEDDLVSILFYSV